MTSSVPGDKMKKNPLADERASSASSRHLGMKTEKEINKKRKKTQASTVTMDLA